MSENGSNYCKVLYKCRSMYDVRELPGCFVIASDNGSVVVYQNGDKKATFTICKGAERDECNISNVYEVIDRYVNKKAP